MNKPFIIGITGGSGSGKTSFIRALKKIFSDTEMCLVSQDDYYLPLEKQLVDEKGIANFDRLESIELDDLYGDIQRLMKGETVTRKEYTFNNQAAEAKILAFKPAPIILVEGLFVLHHKGLRDLMDLKIFVHARTDLKVTRRIKRDRIDRNYPLEDVLYRYAAHVTPAFDKYIKPYREVADITINNNENFEKGLEIVVAFLKHKLTSL
ncbi:MAG: uridine kinase [Saprospiraceae bacterium]